MIGTIHFIFYFLSFLWLYLVPQENCTKFRHHCRIAETYENDFIQKMDRFYSGMDNTGIQFHIVFGYDSGRQMKNLCDGNPFINNSFQIWSGSAIRIIKLFSMTVIILKVKPEMFVSCRKSAADSIQRASQISNVQQTLQSGRFHSFFKKSWPNQ